jgi:NAD(P)H dehydrogenase (quinone)
VGVNDNAEKHNGMEKYRDNFLIFGERFAEKAAELFD